MRSGVVHKLRRASSLLKLALVSSDETREARKLVDDALLDLQDDGIYDCSH